MNVGLLLFIIGIALMFTGNLWVGLAVALVSAFAFGDPPQ